MSTEALGRDAFRAKVVRAARGLFAERGYSGVSVRDIAAAAGVNHGLIHRHFGAKSEVLRAVLQEMFSSVAAQTLGQVRPGDPNFIGPLYAKTADRKLDWLVLTRAVMDGFDFKSAGFDFPLTHAVLRHVAARRGGDPADADVRHRAGAIIAGGIGWLVLESYLSPILGIEDDEASVRAAIGELFAALAEPER